MAYTPNPTDTTQPVGSVAAGTAAAEFRAIKSYLAGILGSVQAFNPLDSTASLTISNGNLTVTKNLTTGNQTAIRAVFSKSSGKWYWEINILSFLAANQQILGIATSLFTLTNYVGSDTQSYGYGGVAGDKYINGVASGFGAAFAVNDVVGFAFDADGNTLEIFKNNASQGTITGLTAGAYFPAISELTLADSLTGVFDAKSLKYAPPAGFSAFYNSNITNSTYASIVLGGTQGVADSTESIVALDTVIFDSKGWWDNSTSRYIPQLAGKYRINASIFSGVNTGAIVLQNTSIHINGAGIRTATLEASNQSTVSVTAILEFNGSTDYLELFGYLHAADNSGGTFLGAGQTWLDIEYIGP